MTRVPHPRTSRVGFAVRRLLVVGLLLLLAALCAGAADVAPGADGASSGPYRGPQNNGIYSETGLLKAWPPEGPRLLWKGNVGEGYGGATVVNNMVYVAGSNAGNLYGFTLDGEQKFKQTYGNCAWKRFGGSKSAVLVRDGIAIVTRPSADIYAIDLKTAETKWTLNAWKNFGTGEGNMGWGYPSTPPVFENKVILNPCSRNDKTPPIVAVDFATGKTVWEADPGAGKKYSCGDHSAAVFVHNGRPLNVNPTWRYILCLDPKDGKRLWEIPDPDVQKGSEKTLTPVYGDGYVLCDRAGKALLIKLSQDGSAFTPVWARPHGGFSHGVVLGKRVYIGGDVTGNVWKGADALPAPAVAQLAKPRLPKGAPPLPPFPGGLLCLDAETGQTVDCLRMRNGLGHVVAADGMLYAVDFARSPEGARAKGEEGNLGLNVFLIKPTAAGMDIVGQFRLPMKIEDAKQVRELEFQANINPVIAAGRLFIRYGPLWVYDLRPDPKAPVAAPAPAAPAAGFWDLRLKSFFNEQRELLVTLLTRDGAVVAGAAVAPAWNRATHTVETKDLKLDGGLLTGSLVVTLSPDAAIPADKKPIVCTVKLQARCELGRLTGEYSGGQADGTRVEGRVTPTWDAPAPAHP